METTPDKPDSPFESRVLALQKRVNQAALALHVRGLKPTVARVRAALGGGSPNELGPAVKHWKEEVLPTLVTPVRADTTASIPAPIADLARELWTRAVAAASVDTKAGEKAIKLIERTEEATALRQQLVSVREQMERDAVAYGEMRAIAARHEAIAREALNEVRAAGARERTAHRKFGEATQRIAELEAALRAKPATARRAIASKRRNPRSTASSRQRKPASESRPNKPKALTKPTRRAKRTRK